MGRRGGARHSLAQRRSLLAEAGSDTRQRLLAPTEAGGGGKEPREISGGGVGQGLEGWPTPALFLCELLLGKLVEAHE